MLDPSKVRKISGVIIDRIKNIQVACFKNTDKPLFLISDQYPGLWLEHTFDSIMLARLEPSYLDIAVNTINLFIDNQTDEGQLPFNVIDENKRPDWVRPENLIGYSQIQECVSFYTLCLEVYLMVKDMDLLERIYESGKNWDKWLRRYRMTTNRGLIEMFCGFDTGHDNSGRLQGMSCDWNYTIDGIPQNASVLPPDDGITPIIAVDMNCNFYGDEKALAKIARILGRDDEAEQWEHSAAEIKKKLFEYCYDEQDAFFYDVDRNGKKRKYLSSTILHLFLERVLDKERDSEIIDRIYREHIKNPKEFWTAYPIPSMAISDPSVEAHATFNCWGYYTQATIVLRCIRWMDYYGYSDDMNYILEKWLEAWTNCYDEVKLGQEIDPITGKPTKCSEWFSSCMMDYLYAARRLNIV